MLSAGQKLVVLLSIAFFMTVVSNNLYAVRVGIFADYGIGARGLGPKEYSGRLKALIDTFDPSCHTKLIRSKDIANNVLDSIDVVVFPGGLASDTYKCLTEKGRKKINEFVFNGGGYIGICAGAYLGRYPDVKKGSLGLGLTSSRSTVPHAEKHVREGVIRTRLTDTGRECFPELSKQDFLYLYYFNGPLLEQADNTGLDNYEELITLDSQWLVGTNPQNKTPTILLRSKFGKGTVILSAAHPEITPGLTWMIPRLIRLASSTKPAELVSFYDKKPFFNGEIPFDSKWQILENRYLTGLYRSQTRYESISNLAQIGSLELFNVMGKLYKDHDTGVRMSAALWTTRYDYIPGLKHLHTALSNETDPVVKQTFIKALSHFNRNIP